MVINDHCLGSVIKHNVHQSATANMMDLNATYIIFCEPLELCMCMVMCTTSADTILALFYPLWFCGHPKAAYSCSNNVSASKVSYIYLYHTPSYVGYKVVLDIGSCQSLIIGHYRSTICCGLHRALCNRQLGAYCLAYVKSILSVFIAMQN